MVNFNWNFALNEHFVGFCICIGNHLFMLLWSISKMSIHFYRSWRSSETMHKKLLNITCTHAHNHLRTHTHTLTHTPMHTLTHTLIYLSCLLLDLKNPDHHDYILKKHVWKGVCLVLSDWLIKKITSSVQPPHYHPPLPIDNSTQIVFYVDFFFELWMDVWLVDTNNF